MKVTNQQIFDIINPLNRLLMQKLPAKLSYRVAKLAKELYEINKQINVQRLEIANKYSGQTNTKKKGPRETVIKVPKEKAQLAAIEIELLMEVPVDVDFAPIQIEEFAGAFIEPDIIIKGEWLFSL